MSEEEEDLFQQSNSCWICKKVRDHCHITIKFTGAAHWDCNINFQLPKSPCDISQFKKLRQSFNFFCAS